MLTEKDLKELIKQGKIQSNDVDFEEQDDLQQQKIELEKQKIDIQKQKLKIEKQKLEQKKDIPQEKKNKIEKSGILYAFLMIFGSLLYVILYFLVIRH